MLFTFRIAFHLFGKRIKALAQIQRDENCYENGLEQTKFIQRIPEGQPRARDRAQKFLVRHGRMSNRPRTTIKLGLPGFYLTDF